MSEKAEMTMEGLLYDRFATVEQQRETSKSGMWLFLATEVMFFGGLFAAYSVYRYQLYEMFHTMSRHLDVKMGTLNTAILLTSSFFMAMAVHASKHGEPGKPGAIVGWLLATDLFGIGFLLVKAHEWTDDYHHGLFPGHWLYQGPHAETGRLFFDLYYAMVGLHGLHVLIGVGLITFYAVLAARGRYSKKHYMPIDVLGLYWHYVDLVWIFLYPLFYLIEPK